MLERLLAAWQGQAQADTSRRLNDHISQYQEDQEMARITQQAMEENNPYNRDRDIILPTLEDLNHRQNDLIVDAQTHFQQYDTDRGDLLVGAQASQETRDMARGLVNEFERLRLDQKQKAKAKEKRLRDTQRMEVKNWLDAPGTSQRECHEEVQKARQDYPGTGKWILKDDKMSMWMNAEVIPTSSMFWLNGGKGTGE